MSGSEGEIEYLDEDEDIVQKCVQSTQAQLPLRKAPLEPKQLLVERAPVQVAKRKKKPQEDDSSDYDPTEDLRQLKKRKPQTNAKSQATTKKPAEVKPSLPLTPKPVVNIEPKEDISIHDYDDPLCLPVKYWGKDTHDSLQRHKWNHLCMQRLRSEDSLKPRVGRTVASRREIVLRNVTSNVTRKLETTIWCKTVVENKAGEQNTEVVQSVLPKYREKTMLDYNIPTVQRKRDTRTTNTVVLSREQHQDGVVLVAYQPSEAMSSVYKLVEPPQSSAESTQRTLRRAAGARACAACYQASWRPTRAGGVKKDIICPICQQPFLSVYNLLSHVRTHGSGEVRLRKKEIARSLARIVDYHYKCRICQQRFFAIRDMRKHVKTSHFCKEKFHCEVGNHITQ